MAAYCRLKGQVCSLNYELVSTWHWPTFTQVNSHNVFATDNGNVINHCPAIIIAVIIITITTIIIT